MNKLNKYYKIIVVILIINLLLCFNKTLAVTEDWDTFYYRFRDEAMTAKGNSDNLSDADLNRMIAGPTKDERMGGATCITIEHLEPCQEKARELKESRVQGGGSTSSRRKYKFTA